MPIHLKWSADVKHSQRESVAITAYFNPVGFQNRLHNYRVFREHLNVPLITVELVFAGSFQLQPGDADILIQVRGGDIMWQKERLLNIALKSLPSDCEKFAWLDCDVVFLRRALSFAKSP